MKTLIHIVKQITLKSIFLFLAKSTLLAFIFHFVYIFICDVNPHSILETFAAGVGISIGQFVSKKIGINA